MSLDSIKRLQKELSSIIGISGYEDDVSKFILEKIKVDNLADKAWIDPLGNTLAIVNGKEGGERILFDAHTDEIGFMISHIEKNGFLRFVLIGGWDVRILLGQAVKIRNEQGHLIDGIMGSKPPHMSSIKERNKVVRVNDMYIDIGLNSAEEVLKSGIQIGTTGTLFSPFAEFPNNMVRGKAFDDRTGCNVLMHLMMRLKDANALKDTILFNFAVQEEVGMKGATTGAFRLNPTIGIAIENTTAGDVPGIKESEVPVFIGKGPAITLADVSMITNSKINKRLIENAKKMSIPYQVKKPMYGATDASKISLTREGVPSTVVSVPCRYIHSPTSLLMLDDIKHTIDLLEAFIQNPQNV